MERSPAHAFALNFHLVADRVYLGLCQPACVRVRLTLASLRVDNGLDGGIFDVAELVELRSVRRGGPEVDIETPVAWTASLGARALFRFEKRVSEIDHLEDSGAAFFARIEPEPNVAFAPRSV